MAGDNVLDFILSSFVNYAKEKLKGNLAVPSFCYYQSADVKRIQEELYDGCWDAVPGSFAAWLSEQTPMHAYLMLRKRYDIGYIKSCEYVKSAFSK